MNLHPMVMGVKKITEIIYKTIAKRFHINDVLKDFT